MPEEAASDPLAAVDWPHRTARLSIRRATVDDTEAMFAYRRLEPVNRWLSRAPRTLEEYRRVFDDPVWQAKALVIEHDGSVIGEMMLGIEDGWAQVDVADQAKGVQAELGWVLAPEHARHGYATEAVEGLLEICFVELGLRRVTANCFAANEPSWRLMERVGMRRETHAVRESLHRSGEWLDGYAYALLDDEWRASRASPAS
jgi:RimJ/RimL family protein N-acetyltransferase